MSGAQRPPYGLNPSALGTDGRFGGRTFVGGEIVHDDNISGFERGRELSFDINIETHAVHECINDK